MCYLSCWKKSTRVDSTRWNNRKCSGSWLRTRWEPRPCLPLCWCWWARSPRSYRSRPASTAAGRGASPGSFFMESLGLLHQTWLKRKEEKINKKSQRARERYKWFAEADWIVRTAGSGGAVVVMHTVSWHDVRVQRWRSPEDKSHFYFIEFYDKSHEPAWNIDGYTNQNLPSPPILKFFEIIFYLA